MRSPRPTCSCVFALCAVLPACPPGDPQSSSDSTGDPGVTTTDAPTTGDESTSSGDADTGEPTSTGGVDAAVTRVVYYPAVLWGGQYGAAAMRFVEIVDGVAAPPVTILDPPGTRLITRDASHRGRWATVYSAPEDPPQMWLVDLQAMTPHEVALPPTVERVDHARMSSDGTHLILRGAPQDSSDTKDMSHHVCAVGPQGECSLQLVEPATGPTTYVSYLFDISGDSGRIWYETEALDATTSFILQGDVDAPEPAATLVSVADAPAYIERIALDESTLYFTTTQGNDMQAIDISVDPAGAPVEIHPPLADHVNWEWADDESSLLVWNGFGKFGDLYRIALDGAVAGPMQLVNSANPGHATALYNSLTADGASILFHSDHETPMFPQLYICDAGAPEPSPVRVNAPIPPGTSVGGTVPAGDPNHVLYSVLDPAVIEVHRARIDPPGEAHQLTAEGTVPHGQLTVSEDGTRLLYVGDLTEGRRDLFLVDIVGEQPAAPVHLTKSLPADLQVNGFPRLSPDATRAFFEAQGTGINERGGLYMVPLSPAIEPPVLASDTDEPVYNFFVLPPQ